MNQSLPQLVREILPPAVLIDYEAGLAEADYIADKVERDQWITGVRCAARRRAVGLSGAYLLLVGIVFGVVAWIGLQFISDSSAVPPIAMVFAAFILGYLAPRMWRLSAVIVWAPLVGEVWMLNLVTSLEWPFPSWVPYFQNQYLSGFLGDVHSVVITILLLCGFLFVLLVMSGLGSTLRRAAQWVARWQGSPLAPN